jgi:hypothetical protein
VDVWRLRTIARVEEKPQRPHPKYCRHVAMLPQPGAEGNVPHSKPKACGGEKVTATKLTKLGCLGKKP